MTQWLVVGLGNPGDTYAKTRHNVGFMVLDAFAQTPEIPKNIHLLKPQTMMNNSGIAVKALWAKYEIQDTRYIVVVHDDIDLPLGSIKISLGSGSAGHKGVESIMKSLDTQDFARIRIGIQPNKGKPKDVETFVLKKFSRTEQPLVEQAIEKACSALETLIAHGPTKAMNEYN